MLFLIVSRSGEPVYEFDASVRTDDAQHLNQFVAHSALDLVDYLTWTTTATSLKCVDRFQDKLVSAFLSPGNTKFLLLHEGRNEENIKNFFVDVHELYLKAMLSPFVEQDSPIKSLAFDKKVRLLIKRV
mmetsp:Transcript_52623/g.119942  ORF Transcript_52623/g.119942 Transcript_52623/m.119942 type:complete len:129 (-) Transcript_52623:247-633(-)|eukprot:CAMPEP_0172600416 /NCGR_PEP_ID=MMETSP1068-20121228/20617_1 /TAXON_ID=35684 /ORGANISM="Pseudopedinella elastica, Strain CCMP716" /LENGTH=128 /DNA_ID=CAMNT_0013401085 /DNA_START=130 /DNA_END=516 /DNA_ORIENTATION=-